MGGGGRGTQLHQDLQTLDYVQTQLFKCFEKMQNELNQDECMQIVRNNKNLIGRLDDYSIIQLLKVMNIEQRSEAYSLLKDRIDKIFNFALSENYLERIKFLIDLGIDIDDNQNMMGNTPLIRAVKYGNPQMVELLLQAGADVGKENINRDTARDIAVRHQKDEIIQMIDDMGKHA